MTNTIIITQENQDRRLDSFLVKNLSDLSRTKIQKMIKNGEILVNDKKVTKHHFLKEKDVIVIPTEDTRLKRASGTVEESLSNKPKGSFTHQQAGSTEFIPSKAEGLGMTKDIKIISETEDFLIIEKPAGLLVHATDKKETGTLVDWLLDKYPKIKNIGEDPLRPGIVHRLDKDVSGLMLIPKTQTSFDYFKQQFKLRTIDKRYLALVYGETSQDTDKINFAIGRSKAKAGLFAARPQKLTVSDKTAITEFDVIDRFKNYTLLEIKILTGRTHQIRVHLKAYGHPLVGDNLYFNKKLKTKKSLSRIFLHAHYLSFTGPDSQLYEFKSALPEKLATFLKSLKK